MFKPILSAVLVACAVGGGWAIVASKPLWYLPAPNQASEESLLHWLALRDLREQPRSLQIELVNRLQADVDPVSLKERTSSESKNLRRYGPRIEQNAELLKKVWFETRCDEYSSCKDDQRFSFLDQQLKAVFEWAAVLDTSGDSGTASEGQPEGTGTASRLLGQIESWVTTASSDVKPEMRRAVHDAAVCWLSSTDLNQYSGETRRYIAQRISNELGKTEMSATNRLPLTAEQQQMLQQNAMLLVEAWANWQAEVYAALAIEHRPAMIDACLDQVQGWHLDQFFAQESAQKPTSLWKSLSLELPQWLQQGGPVERQRLQAFMAHLQQRFLWRSLRRMTMPERDPG